MKAAFLFPGQGAQKVGMGRDLYDACPEAAEYFDRAEDATGLALKKLCFEGPQQELSRTDVAQPAILTVSAAMLAAMKHILGDEQFDRLKPAAAAGLSLGEYTALYAAGAMGFETAVRLVARRGELMQQAATKVPSGMVSVLGLEEDQARKLASAAADGQVLTCANFNCPGQIVLSGQIEACQRAVQLAEQFGAKGAVALDVAGAFHSELMRPAAEEFAEVLAAAQIASPQVQVLSNVDAKPHGQPEDIRAKLLAQLTSPVRWSKCIEAMIDDGIEQFYEIGPGRVLRGLLRRIDRNVNCTCIDGLDAIKKLSERLQAGA